MSLDKLKIAVFHNLPSGGAKRALHEFMRVLNKRGHQLDLYNLSTSDEEFLPLAPFAKNVFTFSSQEFSGIKFRFPFLSGYINLILKLLSFRKLNKLSKKIAAKMDNAGYDLAFVQHCRFTQSPYLLRHLKMPSVYYCQEFLRWLYEPQSIYSRPKRLSFLQRVRELWYLPIQLLENCSIKKINYRNIESADLILANSYYSRESIYRAYGRFPRVSYLGVNGEEFRPLDLPKENLVLSVGGLHFYKGHDFIIEALSFIESEVRPALIIICDRSYRDEKKYLLEIATSKDVNLKILEKISDDRLVNLYNKAKLTLCAQILEPFGLTPLESMACGTPVVGVKEAGIRETVPEGVAGLLTDRDPKEFARAIERLLKDEQLYQEFSKNGREYVCQNWTWEKATDCLLDNFNQVVDKCKTESV